jgi:hypothetical protein
VHVKILSHLFLAFFIRISDLPESLHPSIRLHVVEQVLDKEKCLAASPAARYMSSAFCAVSMLSLFRNFADVPSAVEKSLVRLSSLAFIIRNRTRKAI